MKSSVQKALEGGNIFVVLEGYSFQFLNVSSQCSDNLRFSFSKEMLDFEVNRPLPVHFKF